MTTPWDQETDKNYPFSFGLVIPAAAICDRAAHRPRFHSAAAAQIIADLSSQLFLLPDYIIGVATQGFRAHGVAVLEFVVTISNGIALSLLP